MSKVRISYKNEEEKLSIIKVLKPLGIVKISKEQVKADHKNVYIKLK